VLLGAFAAIGLVAGAVSLTLGQSLNFHVFRQAALDLLAGRDLYTKRADDYFKYSPTFALLFAPLALLPQWISAPAWSLANFMAAFFGIDRVVSNDREKRVAMLVALVGIALSTDGDQSNLLVAGALLLALDAFEKRREVSAASLITGAAFVKLFPAIGATLALFSARRGRAVAALLLSGLAWLVLPLLVLSPRALAGEYASWRKLLSWDCRNHGWSVMSVVQDSMHLRCSSMSLQILGGLLMLLPLFAGAHFGTSAPWRRTLLASLLVVAVLFNHRAEYTSYVLSAIGIAIWYTAAPRGLPTAALVILALVAPGPFHTTVDPRVTGVFAFLGAHRQFHVLRVLPLFAVWLVMLRDLLRPFVTVRLSVTLSRMEEHSLAGR
jgi:hypothetical protein